MKAIVIAITLFLSLVGPVAADFPPAPGELALELNWVDQSMILMANQATDLLGMKITSPLQALNTVDGLFGLVFFVQLQSTTGEYEEASPLFVNLNGNSDLTTIYNFNLGVDYNLSFEYTTFDGLSQGDVNIVEASIACDFTGDSLCNVQDINGMFRAGNLVTGVSVDEGDPFDLNGDRLINATDIDRWLNDAAMQNGYGSPFQRGDTDNVGAVFPTVRDVDITDFNSLAANFDPMGTNGLANTWEKGNFDGDDDIDITDFNFLSAHFTSTGYNSENVPEPQAAVLMVAAGCAFLLIRRVSLVGAFYEP